MTTGIGIFKRWLSLFFSPFIKNKSKYPDLVHDHEIIYFRQSPRGSEVITKRTLLSIKQGGKHCPMQLEAWAPGTALPEGKLTAGTQGLEDARSFCLNDSTSGNPETFF